MARKKDDQLKRMKERPYYAEQVTKGKVEALNHEAQSL